MALLRKYEGRFRRHEVNTDMEDYSTIYFTDIFYFLVSRECWRGKGTWGNIKIGVVIHRRIRMCYLSFKYTPTFTVCQFLVGANEQNL